MPSERQQISATESLAGLLGALWGAGGLVAVLLDAIDRLSGIAMQALDAGFHMFQWAVLVIVVGLMAYVEGYRGFQKSFSPRSAARTYYLYRNPELLMVVLAPLFIMGFFRATRGPLLFAWVGTGLIVLLVVLLQLSAQPWRGIVDAGVVVGLSWGLASFLVELWRVFTSGIYPLSPAVPGTARD
ncbi:MAG: hypothetical protein QF790_03995 [Gammaproteobacteria bacterium]|nr:hypothetical protein [Gammaproteobacteria bacterium]MDP6616312.1 hypothetical protein [Gammaproteobacteria bacterium]MDP6694026.1 hypothetical protein [Gammaproteobacteria bacterium]